MPDSMFGPPSHLLSSQPQTSAGSSAGQSNPPSAPVPLRFNQFSFKSIGKPPELLSRISVLQPDNTEYRSPTPSPISTPPPIFIHDFAKSTPRPTLLQQLAGSDSHPSLASRIQMSTSPSNDAVHITASTSPPPLRITTARRPTEDASLIPPVEVLPQPPGSSPTTPASWAPALETDLHSSTFSTPLIHTTAITASQIHTPPIITASQGSVEHSPSSAVVDAMLRPSSSAGASIDSLVSRQDRLQSISAMLANLAPPPLLPFSQSPPADHSSATRASITPDQPAQPQRIPTPVVLHHPYPANHSSGRMRLPTDGIQTHTNESSLVPVPSPTPLTQEYQAQSKTIVAAVQNLTSALNIAHRAQVDNENALALRVRTFEEQRTAFEETKRAQETALQQEFQELQRKREELNAKEAVLVSLEKENKAREEARKGILAKRQAQEEEKRAAEAKRVHEVQEQITTAIDELKEIEALKAKCQIPQLATEILGDDLPSEPQLGMDEDEKATIKTRTEPLCAVKHLRRMHTDKSQKLEETNRTLRSLGEERKKREAEEAQRRRIAEEERLRAHAEMERQLLDERRRQAEVEKKCQQAESNREQARLLAEQQAHAEAQANGLGHVRATNGQTVEQLRYPEEVDASQRQGTADTSGIRAPHEENSFAVETTNAMNVDDGAKDFALNRTSPSSDAHVTPATLQSKQKKAKPISGGVMLAPSTAKATGGHLPPKLSASQSPTLAMIVDTNMPGAPPAVSTPPPLPAQPASVSNRASADVRATPDYKSAFSRTPKSQTILDLTNGPNQELNINIGPLAGVSPAQQNVNLRHLKRFRGRAEGNDSGDRSVRTIPLKSEGNNFGKEEQEDVKASVLANHPASLPLRPVIPPPRPRMSKKRSEAPAVQTDSYPPQSNELSSTNRGTGVTVDEQPREVPPNDTQSSQIINAPVQLPVSSEPMNSLLLGTEQQASEFRINTGERATRDQNGDTTPSEPASATFSHEFDGEDSPRNNRRFSDEHRRTRKVNSSRRMTDHYSPPFATSRPLVASPTQPHRPIDSWRPQNPSNRPRAEPMRATSPIAGRKRPSEFNDNEYGHRARRQRADVWIAPDPDHDWGRPQRDRRPDLEFAERHGAHRAPISPVDRTRPFPSDVPRTTYDNRTHAPDEASVPVAQWEQAYRRAENEDTHQRYQAAVPVYNTMTDQHPADDGRSGKAYEPMTEEGTETQPDLLSRIHDIQSFPPRGRGRGEPSRGKGRGRGVARGGTPLLERLTSAPWKGD